MVLLLADVSWHGLYVLKRGGEEGREEEAAPPDQLLYTCSAAVYCINLLLRPIKDQLSYGFALVNTLYCR